MTTKAQAVEQGHNKDGAMLMEAMAPRTVQHTPGPLHAGHIGEGQYRRECVFEANSNQVATMINVGPRGVADATLHAAAPELLELLREARAYCPVAVQDRIDAIAKATGGKP